MKNPECLFCKIIDKKIPSEIVYEDDLCFAFTDVNPQAPVHILVVPKNHISQIHEMNSQDREQIGHLFFAAKKIAEQSKLEKKGYRMVINNGEGAGQTVFHVHLHLLSGRAFGWPPG